MEPVAVVSSKPSLSEPVQLATPVDVKLRTWPVTPELEGNSVPPSVKVPVKLEFTKVLLVSVSVPAIVAIVPEVGSVIFVMPVVLMVVE